MYTPWFNECHEIIEVMVADQLPMFDATYAACQQQDPHDVLREIYDLEEQGCQVTLPDGEVPSVATYDPKPSPVLTPDLTLSSHATSRCQPMSADARILSDRLIAGVCRTMQDRELCSENGAPIIPTSCTGAIFLTSPLTFVSLCLKFSLFLAQRPRSTTPTTPARMFSTAAPRMDTTHRRTRAGRAPPAPPGRPRYRPLTAQSTPLLTRPPLTDP